MERALVRGPLTGERDRHPVVLAAREHERLPERGRQPFGDDARAREVDVRVEQVQSRGVQPELRLLTLAQVRARIETGDDPALLAARRHVAGAGILGQLA